MTSDQSETFQAPGDANACGIVIIGRNEGERLRRCFASVVGSAAAIVYVDSGSTDDSVSAARQLGVEVVELDMSSPFCAARARNAGYQRLMELDSRLTFVQFVDGDCELVTGWLSAAAMSLESLPRVAIVTGRLHERSPERSIYNRLGNLEWNFAGAGDVESVGGIFMIRSAAFEAVGRFDASIAAGEEPELCQRLIQQGWRLLRLDKHMAWHDLAMVRFGQWWKRMVRFGYGSSDVALRFGLPRFRRNNLRARVWTLWLVAVIVVGAIVASFPTRGAGLSMELVLVGLWPLQLTRIAMRTWRGGQPFQLAAAYAASIMISYLPQMLGQMLCWSDRARNRPFRLVEHKAENSASTPRDNQDV